MNRPTVAGYPFLQPRFLDALAASGSIGASSGWTPLPQTVQAQGAILATMPLYLKTHSWGEYVFDWAWAEAYQRNGLDYYPKLVTAAPFSPATGPRVSFADGADRAQLAGELFAGVKLVAAETGASGWHLLFPDQATLTDFSGLGLLHRTGVQFHWHNHGYRDFDDFVDRFVARKRKMVRRERRRVAEQGLRVEMLPGEQISAELWTLFLRLYQRTYRKRSGHLGYLKGDFFARVGAAMPTQIAMAVTYDGGEAVACALYFHDADTLYGRYWGCLREYDGLHFELCYYQGIEFAIARGLSRFDAGAQGEHKLLRGFDPVLTHSLHWIKHPRFANAIADFVAREHLANRAYIEEAQALLPFREASSTAARLGSVGEP